MGHAKKVKFGIGLVTLNARVEVAVDKESSGAHAICTGTEEKPHPPSRVKQSTSCPVEHCGITHSSHYGFTKRGIERDGMLVELTRDELVAAAGTPLTGGKDQPPVPLAWHARDDVYGATLASDSVQNVYPDKGSEKPYALLRDYLHDNPEIVAVVTWAPSSKNALWVLEVVDERLVLSKRCYPEEVRATEAIPPVDYSDQEAAFMAQLIEASVTDFDPLEYQNLARRGVEELVAARTGDAVPAAAAAGPTVVGGDFLAALQASVDAIKPKAAPRAVKKAATKKTAAKKAPAKKAAAKRPVKKSA